MENTVEKVMDLVEEAPVVVEAVRDYGFAKGTVVGLGIGAGANLLYKFVVKPVAQKVKDKKAAKAEQVIEADSNVVEFSDVDVFTEE